MHPMTKPATANAAPIVTEEQIAAYQEREYARTWDGTYTRLPDAWTDSLWFKYGARDYDHFCELREKANAGDPSGWAPVPMSDAAKIHFPHVSLDDGAQIAFTESHIKGVADRQTRMRPGRYLTKYFGHVLSAETITQLATSFAADYAPMPLQIATDGDDIEQIYIHGPRSCMSYKPNEYSGHCHPVHVYGGSDLQLAWIGADADNVKARALIWPERKRYSTIYGDALRLEPLLKAAGYTSGSMRGARVRALEDENGHGLIMPYVDGCSYGERDGRWVRLGDGDLDCQPTSGTTEESRYSCDDCGDTVRSEDDLYYCEDDNQTLCRHCDERQRFYCDRLGVTCAGERVEMANGDTWSSNAFDRYGATCAINGENYPADEMVEMTDGDMWSKAAFDAEGFTCAATGERHHTDDMVTLADGTTWHRDHFDAHGHVDANGDNARNTDAPADKVQYRCPDTAEMDFSADQTAIALGAIAEALDAAPFKPGDWVECTDSTSYSGRPEFTAGKLYQVLEYVRGDIVNTVRVCADDSGNVNGWSEDNFNRLVWPAWHPGVSVPSYVESL